MSSSYDEVSSGEDISLIPGDDFSSLPRVENRVSLGCVLPTTVGISDHFGGSRLFSFGFGVDVPGSCKLGFCN